MTPADSPPPAEWMDIPALARHIGLSPRTVKNNVYAGRFPHVRIGTRTPGRRDVRPVRFTPEQVAEIAARYHRVEVVPAGGAG